MALAMKIYKSDGEVELDNKEFKLLKDFGQGFPLFYQDALGLLEAREESDNDTYVDWYIAKLLWKYKIIARNTIINFIV